MTKRELIFNVAQLCRLPLAQVETAINATLDVIRYELVADREVNLKDFGKFSVKERAARNGHNPRTGEGIQIPAHKRPYFNPGKALKQAVNHD